MQPAIEPPIVPAPGVGDAAALSHRLREATAPMHRQVERSGFMAALLRGQFDQRGYVVLLCNLQALYGALEAALLAHRGDPAITAVVMPGLFRSQALARDLQWLAGPDELPPLCPATLHYIERLRGLQAAASPRLVAHAYVRYLGDLNGGQVLKRVVERTLGLQGGLGTTFYDFGDAAEVRQLMQRFRAGLDAAGRREADAQAIVDEAVDSFERHRQLFTELGTGG